MRRFNFTLPELQEGNVVFRHVVPNDARIPRRMAKTSGQINVSEGDCDQERSSSLGDDGEGKFAANP